MSEELRMKIEELSKKHLDLQDEIIMIKANGDLAKLFNLREQAKFDENIDTFFDDPELRKKYNDWDYENDCIKFEKTNQNLLQELDKEDLEKYIKFYERYISTLEDELALLKIE